MCFYICSGYFNLMLNKLRPRLKDNNVSSSTQASLPERVIAHQQAGRQAGGSTSGGKLANSHHRRSRSSHACVSCLSPVKVAEAPSPVPPTRTSWLGKDNTGQERKGWGSCIEICLKEIFMSWILFKKVMSLMNMFKDCFTIYNLYVMASSGKKGNFQFVHVNPWSCW